MSDENLSLSDATRVEAEPPPSHGLLELLAYFPPSRDVTRESFVFGRVTVEVEHTPQRTVARYVTNRAGVTGIQGARDLMRDHGRAREFVRGRGWGVCK